LVPIYQPGLNTGKKGKKMHHRTMGDVDEQEGVSRKTIDISFSFPGITLPSVPIK